VEEGWRRVKGRIGKGGGLNFTSGEKIPNRAERKEARSGRIVTRCLRHQVKRSRVEKQVPSGSTSELRDLNGGHDNLGQQKTNQRNRAARGRSGGKNKCEREPNSMSQGGE